MTSTNFYAGIGSRKTPKDMLEFMTKIATILQQKGYTLRSGRAFGCDAHFERGSNGAKEIFLSKDALPWAFEMAKKYVPNDRPKTFDTWDPYVRGLLARNMMQILGEDGNKPVEFVVCWTPQGDYNSSEVGGTGYALRLALDRGIPIYNLNYPEQLELFKVFIRGLFK